MHPAIENILERPTSHKVGIWFLVLLLIIGGFWQYSLSELITQQEELSETVLRLDSEIATEKRLAANFDKAEARLADLEARLKEALAQLPDKSEVDNLLEKVSNLARESGLELNLFQRKEENFREFYAEVPVAVSITGSYHQVATFFDEVGRLSRIININQISIHDPKIDEESISVKVDCILTAFRYLSEQERSERSADTDKRKRR